MDKGVGRIRTWAIGRHRYIETVSHYEFRVPTIYLVGRRHVLTFYWIKGHWPAFKHRIRAVFDAGLAPNFGRE